MRQLGFEWQPNRVAQVETRRTVPSIEELLAVAQAPEAPVDRLLRSKEPVHLSDRLVVNVDAVLHHGDGMITLVEVKHGAPGEAREDLRRIASKLALSPKALDEVAVRLWGSAFITARDKRVGCEDDPDQRSLQSKRGHVTRRMMREIAAHLGV